MDDTRHNQVYDEEDHEKSTFKWTINKFCLYPFSKTDQLLESSEFTSHRYNKWKVMIKVFKDSIESSIHDQIAVYMLLVSSHTPDVKAKFGIYTINAAQTKVMIGGCSMKEPPVTFIPIKKTPEDLSGLVCSFLCNKNQLLNQEDTTDRQLTLIIEVIEYGIAPIISRKLKLGDLHEAVFRDYRRLFESEKAADVTIVVGKKEFRVHKAILMARSPVFGAMFSYNMIETQKNRVIINDMDPQVVHKMLEFIYVNNISNCDGVDPVDLIAAADKYQLKELKEIGGEILHKTITADNVAEIIDIADYYNCEELSIYARKIAEKYENMMSPIENM